MTSEFKGEIKVYWAWSFPYSISILTATSQGLRFLRVIAEENGSKPHSGAGNQAQVHLTPKSMLLPAISRNSQAVRLTAGHL